MKVYKAGTRYFSTYQEAKIYREKNFNSSRWIETIEVGENTIKSTEDMVVRAYWYKYSSSRNIVVRSYWCAGTISEFLKTDSCLNVLNISRPKEDVAYVDTFLVFRNMGAAKYRIYSKKFLDFLELEISKVPVGNVVQIKI
jgi:hypothetical protein